MKTKCEYKYSVDAGQSHARQCKLVAVTSLVISGESKNFCMTHFKGAKFLADFRAAGRLAARRRETWSALNAEDSD